MVYPEGPEDDAVTVVIQLATPQRQGPQRRVQVTWACCDIVDTGNAREKSSHFGWDQWTVEQYRYTSPQIRIEYWWPRSQAQGANPICSIPCRMDHVVIGGVIWGSPWGDIGCVQQATVREWLKLPWGLEEESRFIVDLVWTCECRWSDESWHAKKYKWVMGWSRINAGWTHTGKMVPQHDSEYWMPRVWRFPHLQNSLVDRLENGRRSRRIFKSAVN